MVTLLFVRRTLIILVIFGQNTINKKEFCNSANVWPKYHWPRSMSVDERQEKARPALEFAFADQFSGRGASAKLKLHFFYQNDAFFVV